MSFSHHNSGAGHRHFSLFPLSLSLAHSHEQRFLSCSHVNNHYIELKLATIVKEAFFSGGCNCVHLTHAFVVQQRPGMISTDIYTFLLCWHRYLNCFSINRFLHLLPPTLQTIDSFSGFKIPLKTHMWRVAYTLSRHANAPQFMAWLSRRSVAEFGRPNLLPSRTGSVRTQVGLPCARPGLDYRVVPRMTTNLMIIYVLLLV